MRKVKKLNLILLLLLIFVFVLGACKKEDQETGSDTTQPTQAVEDSDEDEKEEEETEPTAAPTPTPEPPRDLGGIAIKVADWFTTEAAEPQTKREIDTLAYREDLQKTHNFTLTQENIGTWAEYQELFITSTMAGAPIADIFIMDPKFVPEPLKQGLFYPISDLPSFDVNAEMWNKSVTELMTQNGKVYGFGEEKDTPGLGIFWNKRLFEEAGLDPDLLYDLQKNGEWNWAKLEEISNKLTKDVDSDGITDIYAICCWQVEFVKAAVFSNGSDYVRFNEETGRYENNQMSDDYLEGVKLGVDFFKKGYIMPDPEGAEFTWFENAFKSAQAAMCVTEWYRNPSWQDMEDDWGYCFFPKGPGPEAQMRTMYLSNVRIMPSTADPKRADDVAFAYANWVSAPPGYENEEEDYSYYYSVVRDARAVEETIMPMIKGQGFRSLLYQVPGLSFRYGSNMDGGGLGALSAIEIAEEASAQFDALIADFYAE